MTGLESFKHYSINGKILWRTSYYFNGKLLWEKLANNQVIFHKKDGGVKWFYPK